MEPSSGRVAVRVRPTGEAELDFVLAAENAPENRDYIFQWSREQHLKALADPGYAHLLVESEPGGLAGYAILAGVNSAHRSLELMRLVITLKGQGYGRAALERLKIWAFEEGAANRLWLDVVDSNTRAQRLYSSAGFQREGLLREAYRKDGQYINVIIYSILRREFQTAK